MERSLEIERDGNASRFFKAPLRYYPRGSFRDLRLARFGAESIEIAFNPAPNRSGFNLGIDPEIHGQGTWEQVHETGLIASVSADTYSIRRTRTTSAKVYNRGPNAQLKLP
jgi:hypothetical protein